MSSLPSSSSSLPSINPLLISEGARMYGNVQVRAAHFERFCAFDYALCMIITSIFCCACLIVCSLGQSARSITLLGSFTCPAAFICLLNQNLLLIVCHTNNIALICWHCTACFAHSITRLLTRHRDSASSCLFEDF